MSQTGDLETRLDTLTTAILMPMRASKQINHQALDGLNNLIQELITQIGDEPAISRRLTGKLWFIFTQMLAEADHTQAPEAILRSAWNYEDQLEKLFGPWYGQGPPAHGVPRY